MQVFTDKNDPQVCQLLKNGAVGILRTDTLYGLVCRADNQISVERIYKLKDRDSAKSPIVLIASTDQLFDAPTDAARSLLSDAWPGKVSVILPSEYAPTWIKRNNQSVAYRFPDDTELQALLQKTGPLIAPSANPEGDSPAQNIEAAKKYFGDAVDFYVDGGTVSDDTPSQLLRVSADGGVERLR